MSPGGGVQRRRPALLDQDQEEALRTLDGTDQRTGAFFSGLTALREAERPAMGQSAAGVATASSRAGYCVIMGSPPSKGCAA